jgi:hypothetical protein
VKVIYGYALFIGAAWGLAVGTHKHWIELFCMFFALIGWAAVCGMDKNVQETTKSVLETIGHR